MKWVTLIWNKGEEAVCPECNHRNACLHTGNIGNTTIYECRDCHAIFATDNSNRPGRKEHEKNLVQDAILVKRTLGKNCSECGSFNIKDMSYAERRIYNEKAKNPWELREHICGDCGKVWG